MKNVAIAPPAAVSPHVDDLVAIAAEYSGQGNLWSLRVADILSCLGFHDAAARVARDYQRSIPATTEKMPMNLFAQCALANYELEAAIARDDHLSRDAALDRWKAAEDSAIQDEDENRDARRPFFEPFLSDDGD